MIMVSKCQNFDKELGDREPHSDAGSFSCVYQYPTKRRLPHPHPYNLSYLVGVLDGALEGGRVGRRVGLVEGVLCLNLISQRFKISTGQTSQMTRASLLYPSNTHNLMTLTTGLTLLVS